jgi:uncharacterized phage protein (TIGR02220 family)
LKAGHPIVDTIAKIHLEGNVIPHNWFNNIKLESGKPDVISIILLSEIVYWYRPTIVKDELTGQIQEVKKRFKADLLQRSYDSFAEQFGFTKRQVKDAMKRLEDNGLIKRVFRNIETNNMKLSNVLFIDLNVEEVARITFESDTYDVKTEGVLRLNVTPMTIKRQTNTEITTKNTTDNIPYVEIVNYLNQHADRKYSPNTKKTRSCIRARWNEGFRLEDFKLVIEYFCKEWKGKKFSNGMDGDFYLRPSTLFNEKFDERLNIARSQINKQPKQPRENIEHLEKMKRLWGVEK